MKVFKFGGASIKSAEAIRNMSKIVSLFSQDKLLIVVSAMGKTTNALEELVNAVNTEHIEPLLEKIEKYHTDICHELFSENDPIFSDLENQFAALRESLLSKYEYNQLYDQVVSKGEIISSKIITAYLGTCDLDAQWVDAREYIRTDDSYREGKVNWTLTEGLIKHDIRNLAESKKLVTQGFLGGTDKGFTTTLGREGSDFTAAIFAFCIEAESVTVWKDVPGILNADPKLTPNAVLFDELPYNEAAEMTYYGASVIHPKTIKPLANKGIPLYVKNFDNPTQPGTVIHNCQIDNQSIPAIIIKKDQCLVSFKVIDYSFINEENLSVIFKTLSDTDIKINIMQNSAISFSIVVDYSSQKLQKLMLALKNHFDIRYNTGLELITVKNYNEATISEYRQNKKILLEQISRNNYRALVMP